MRLLLLTSLLFITAILALSLTWFDVYIIERIASIHEPFRYAMTYVTEFGKSEYYLVPALLLGLFFWWRGRAATTLCARMRHYWRASICAYLFTCVAIAGLAGNVLKFLIGRSRPKEWLESGLYGLDPFTLASRWHSFPSGHANTMVAVVIALVPFTNPRWHPYLAVTAGVIIASRCIVAAHFVSDILGGALLAALVCLWLQRYAQKHYRLPFLPAFTKLR